MLLSFPHMGKIHLALAEALQVLEIPYLLPAAPGPKSLLLGQELAPEGSCLPFCLVLGNMREALDLGADTILMLGGSGPCRFGYFVYLAEQLLRHAGYQTEFLVIDNGRHLRNLIALKKKQQVSWTYLLKAVQCGWYRMLAEELLSALEREYLAQAVDPRLFREKLVQWRSRLVSAHEIPDMIRIRQEAEDTVKRMPRYPASEVLRVGLVGDIYTMLEPFANNRIEEFLIGKGISIVKTMAVSAWLPNILLPWKRGSYRQNLLQQAYPYLRHSVGGFGLESVAHTRNLALRKVDCMIQLFPMGCMPEIVACSALNKLGQDENIPILSITLDQHDSMTGFETRVEAFLEMVEGIKVNKKALCR